MCSSVLFSAFINEHTTRNIEYHLLNCVLSGCVLCYILTETKIQLVVSVVLNDIDISF